MYAIENYFGERKIEKARLALGNQENEILTLIKAYYNQPVPQAGQDVRIELPGRINILDFHCPVIAIQKKILILFLFLF